MELLIIFLTTLIGLQHLGFMYLEMFLWTQPFGMKLFGNSLEEANNSKVLAANQGLYNGFLAAGLFWSLLYPDPAVSYQIRLFFLCCVALAGIYGGLTAGRRIIYIQAFPAIITIILVLVRMR
ncbi:MAG: DUF1304 domain-containing protein [Anaerolineae bacterium]|nr:DUF1304 domain-containing protein [Anaerolineae bacterium]